LSLLKGEESSEEEYRTQPTKVKKKFRFYIAGPLKFESSRMFLDKIEEIVRKYGFDTWSPYKDAGLLSDKDLRDPQRVKEVLEKDIQAFDECDGAIFFLDGEHSGTIFELGYAYYIARKKSDFPLIGVYTTIRGVEALDSMIRFCFEKGRIVTSLSELEKVVADFKKNIYKNRDERQGKISANLEVIENEFRGKNYQIELFTEELTAICPFTGLPDYYKLHVIYIPDENLIELKSLKSYLIQFKDVKVTHESLANKIFEDLFNLLRPKYLKIELEANVRGGIKTIVKREEKTC